MTTFLLHLPDRMQSDSSVGAVHAEGSQVKRGGLSTPNLQDSESTDGVYPGRHCVEQASPETIGEPSAQPVPLTLSMEGTGQGSSEQKSRVCGFNLPKWQSK